MNYVWNIRVAPVVPENVSKEEKASLEMIALHYLTHDIYVAAPHASLAMRGALGSLSENCEMVVVNVQRKEKLTALMIGPMKSLNEVRAENGLDDV